MMRGRLLCGLRLHRWSYGVSLGGWGTRHCRRCERDQISFLGGWEYQ